MKYFDESKKNKKPLITSECFWGALDDAERVRLMKVSLDVFKKCEIGFIAHALMYSKCTDLHDENDGRVSPDVGNLCFIGKDRKIRPGHEVFNSY